ncbi:PQQ-dependent sugar dehydrogenase [Halobacteria archaeon AArc-m2/3/4]|uniref:PQQ-dependent sugar dehydrogenase n=1 Tax=Natronoglomus mannanivorans TaxID=2979990 RepID=A0AAP3E3S1_9EURY|nr:PQQ-dependent sugar dehydrogenase [Halobacteria archaeon AArc-xg1-1]MCU4975560.1 PQQ-dependent sugar dehydrogenase [Halobacteria archaeon AArc-m2/3/4]
MTDNRWSRRSVLASAGVVGAVGVAGCLSDDDSSSTELEDVTPVESDYELSVDHDGLESWDRYDPDWTPPTDSPLEADLEYEILVENLEVPWDLSFAPDGDLFISERTGRIHRFGSGELEAVAEPADIIDAEALEPGTDEQPWWVEGGEGGLLGIAVHPAYPDPALLYAFYTYDTDDGERNRLVFVDVSADDPAATETTVIDDIEGGLVHNGCRLAFGPENYLWVTTGDANRNDWEEDVDPISQELTSLAGKVLRIEPDGTPAPDNPDLEGGDPRIFSYGHRNPQGISWLPDGTPIVSEHGPGARDEVMVLAPGDNHGWSVARDAETYPDSEFARPVVNTGPGDTWAPSGCVFYTGEDVPEWRNRLVVGTLTSQHVNVVTVYPADSEADEDEDETPTDDGGTRYDADWMHEGYDAVSHRTLEDELGRVRHVEQGPDGGLYAITSNRDGRADDGFPTEQDDVLVRLTPAE